MYMYMYVYAILFLPELLAKGIETDCTSIMLFASPIVIMINYDEVMLQQYYYSSHVGKSVLHLPKRFAGGLTAAV